VFLRTENYNAHFPCQSDRVLAISECVFFVISCGDQTPVNNSTSDRIYNLEEEDSRLENRIIKFSDRHIRYDAVCPIENIIILLVPKDLKIVNSAQLPDQSNDILRVSSADITTT